MLQAQNARVPFLTKKRSFDLAWGAWAGILAVMTAVGASLSASQILLMFPKEVAFVELKYPSMPRSEKTSMETFGGDTLAFFWGTQGLIYGRINDVVAPQESGKIVVSEKVGMDMGRLSGEVETWFRKNLQSPVKVVAVGESVRRAGTMTIPDYARLAVMIQQLNKKVFSVEIKPAVIPIALENPI